MADLRNDIKKYLQGELSPGEMHVLEKRALNDPFLADALEGGESINHPDFTRDLEHLQSSLHARVKKGKTTSPWLWPAKIAAALLLLFITGYVIFQFSDVKDRGHDLALNKPAPSEPKEIGKETTPTPTGDNNQNQSSQSVNPKVLGPIFKEEKEANNKSTQAVEKNQAKQPVPIVNEAPSPTVETSDSDLSKQEEIIITEQKAREQVNDKRDNPSVAIQGSTSKIKLKKAQKVVSGKVIDAEDGTGLPGVAVTVKGAEEGTVTDIEGNYKINLDDAQATLVFSFVGLQNVEVPVENKDSMNVEMLPDLSELSEVIVVGYSPETGVTRAEEYATYQPAEPMGGKKAFKNYLVNSMQYPQQAIENGIEGRVTVQFTVETTGLIKDFKVVRGIGFGCDDEVIRLVKNGPKWNPTKTDDARLRSKVKVRLRFALPD